MDSSSAPQPAQDREQQKARTCSGCNARMSRADNDPHVICSNCRGQECDFDTRCIVCREWSDDKMKLYINHQKSLARKRASKKRLRDRSQSQDFSTLCIVGDHESVSSGVN